MKPIHGPKDQPIREFWRSRARPAPRAPGTCDLGHGLCANPFYEQCPHRMACARCPFYRPKPSTLEANTEGAAHLRKMTRMQQALTLTDDELAAVTEGADLLQALVDKLKDVPTPGGPTPHERRAGAS